MFNKHKRSSLNANLLENESEEKLLEKIAEIQALLDEVDEEENNAVIKVDSSDEENNEPRKYSRRQESPIPSVRPKTPINDDSNDNDEFDRYSQFGNKPFYSLPSTSKGYSPAYPKVYDNDQGNFSKFHNQNSQNFTRGQNITREEPEEETWVPLTFLDKRSKIATKPGQPLYRPPKVIDLSRKAIIEQNMKERAFEEERRSRSPNSENEKRHKKRYYFPDIAEKRRKKRLAKEEKIRKRENEESQKSKLLTNPLSIKKENSYSDDDNDDDEKISRNRDYYYDRNSGEKLPETKYREMEKKRKNRELSPVRAKRQKVEDCEESIGNLDEPIKEKTKQEELTEDVKPNVNILKNLGKNFNACVSIASKLPDDALLPLRFLNLLPLGKIKTENTNWDTSESTSSTNNDVSTIVTNILKQEKPDDYEEQCSTSMESTNLKKIDFSKELKRFSQKLKIIKNEEEYQYKD